MATREKLRVDVEDVMMRLKDVAYEREGMTRRRNRAGRDRCSRRKFVMTVQELLALLKSDAFRYELHRWAEDEWRHRPRSPSDFVTDLLWETVKRLETRL